MNFFTSNLFVIIPILSVFWFAVTIESHPLNGMQQNNKDSFEDKNGETTSSLMNILDAIVNDPEFLQLESRQQLRLLMIIYDMLEAHYKRQFGAIDG